MINTWIPIPPQLPHIVLVHGAFNDGSVWLPVIERLHAQGYGVTAVQNPLSSLADDVQATERVVNRYDNVILVGHSWAGAVIGEAGNLPQVKALVYSSHNQNTDNPSAPILVKPERPKKGVVYNETSH